MQTTAPEQTFSYRSPQTAGRPRVNARMIAFLLVLAAPFVLAVGMYIRSSMQGGIQHSGDVSLVDLKSLGYFPFDQNSGTLAEVPAKWRELNGKRVQLEGFMWNGQSAAGKLSEFQFVYNIQKCCFNGPPLVQERVFVHVPNGRTVPYYGDFCKITGTLHVNVKRDAKADTGVSAIVSIYTLDVDNVELES